MTAKMRPVFQRAKSEANLLNNKSSRRVHSLLSNSRDGYAEEPERRTPSRSLSDDGSSTYRVSSKDRREPRRLRSDDGSTSLVGSEHSKGSSRRGSSDEESTKWKKSNRCKRQPRRLWSDDEGEGEAPPKRQNDQTKRPATIPSIHYRVESVKSLDDLLERCETARREKWAQVLTLAQIRSRLGFPLLKDIVTEAHVEQLKSLYAEFLTDVQRNEEASRFLEPLFGSSMEEPEPGIVLFQFLSYADCAPCDPDLVRLADIIAKDPTIGSWCREILRYPNDFHESLLECSLAHLAKMSFIIDVKEKMIYVKSVIFRLNKKRKERLNELRDDLVGVVSRKDGVGSMIIAHALYLHNSVELVAYGKNEDNPLSEKHTRAFQRALERCRGDFPTEASFERIFHLISPRCSGPDCLKRGPFECCSGASYCSQECRDAHWKAHRKLCDHGKKNKVEINICSPEELIPKASKVRDDGGQTAFRDETSAKTEDESEDGSMNLEEQINNRPWQDDNGDPNPKEDPGETDFEENFDSLPWESAAPKTPKGTRTDGVLALHESFGQSFHEFNQSMANVLESPAQLTSRSVEPSDALKKQNSLLFASPGIDYFVRQDWGNVGLQFKEPNDKHFRKLRVHASEEEENIHEMYRMLLNCCPSLKADIRAQLEKEYEMSLGLGASVHKSNDGMNWKDF